MAKKAPYFPFYVEAFLGSNKVAAMTTAEVGAYALLLARAWGEVPPATIPSDDVTLALWARMAPGEWDRAKCRVLAPWSDVGNGRLRNPRLYAEFQKMQTLARTRSQAGSAGAGARWQSNGKRMAKPSQSDASLEIRVQSSEQNQKAKDTPPPPARPEIRLVPVSQIANSEGVRDANPLIVRSIWQAYPASGRVGFQRARQAIAAALAALVDRGEPDPAAWLVARVQAFAASPAGKAGKFVPHAFNWFDSGRYDDPPEAWQRAEGDAPKPLQTPEEIARMCGVEKP